MGAVTCLEQVGDVQKFIHFEVFTDFMKYEEMMLERLAANESTIDDDGWHDNPGYMPVLGGTHVAVKFRNGDMDSTEYASYWNWCISDSGYSVTKYKVIN
jgi:hypothetical protein